MKTRKILIFLLMLSFLMTSVAFADTLKVGSSGQQVKNIQTQLKKLGFLTGKVDGHFGSQTKAAVQKFQKSKGLTVDGKVGPATAAALTKAGTSTTAASTSTTASRGTTSSNLVTAKYGQKGENVKTIQAQLIKLGYLKGKADGDFGSATKAAVKSFQKKNKLTADGIVGPATAKLLFSSNTSNTTVSRGTVDRENTQAVQAEKVNDVKSEGTKEKVEETKTTKVEYGELLDWWTEASKIFYRGAVAKVTDLKTGKTWNIKRTYGSNHADCEALTKADADIMKEVWGGQWSWTRRAVIIEVGGRRIAASMAGMPHAGVDSKPANVTVSGRSEGYGTGVNLDTIKGNGQNGHFDVHFLNSRTHGTNKVNAAHQQMVKAAAGK